MYFTNFDDEQITPTSIKRATAKLKDYREHVAEIVNKNNSKKPEYSLVHAKNPELHSLLAQLKKDFKGIEQLVLVGIGGSNLGTEAVHSVLDQGKVELHSLDTVSAVAMDRLIKKLQSVRSVKKIAVCVISKSGNTAETLVNAGVLLEALEKKFKKTIYSQTLFIGNPDTEFMKAGKRLGARTIAMPESIGGRYSVGTEVGLVPLALLGHDTDMFIDGFLDASLEEFETLTAESAARVYQYIQKGYCHYNFFAFETRLTKLGAWYRQLTAESLGKAEGKDKQPVTKGFIPTISTAVELHSVGQLYLSGFKNVYTDFVTFDGEEDTAIPKKSISKHYGTHTMQEVATAIYGGVIGAYQEKNLPYRSIIFDDSLSYSLGLFMGMRMRETMYVAYLMNVDAFNQPNVESYKKKTRAILGL